MNTSLLLKKTKKSFQIEHCAERNYRWLAQANFKSIDSSVFTVKRVNILDF